MLAPKDIWNTLYPGEDESVGLGSITTVVEPYKRNEKGKKTGDRKNITVQPSGRVRHGVFFSLNDHHKIDERKGKDLTTAEYAIKIIDDLWQETWDESTHVFEAVIKQCLAK